ncbi:hypothetical protein ACLOJK_004894, partial [Asimina triloba]
DVLRDLPHLFTKRALEAREPDDGFATGQASKSVDAALGSEAESVAPIEGRAAEVVVLDSDEGSGGPSRREGFRGSSFGPVFLLDVNVEFIKPFRVSASSYSARLQ